MKKHCILLSEEDFKVVQYLQSHNKDKSKSLSSVVRDCIRIGWPTVDKVYIGNLTDKSSYPKEIK